MSCQWEMIGAIGQWAGAIATFAAVWVALQPYREKVVIYSYWSSYKEYDDPVKVECNVVLENRGYQPISVVYQGVCFTAKGEKAPSLLPLVPRKMVRVNSDVKSNIDIATLSRGDSYSVIYDIESIREYLNQTGKLTFIFRVMGKRKTLTVKTGKIAMPKKKKEETQHESS